MTAYPDQPDQLPCCEILLRGIKEDLFEWDPVHDAPWPTAAAFIRRLTPPPPENTISVVRQCIIPPDDVFDYWGEQGLRVAAACSLHTGRVRDIGLSVYATRSADDAAHADIVGTPIPDAGDEVAFARALDFANALRDMARLQRWRAARVESRVLKRCKPLEQ
jgi:hypothetical protein